MRVSVRLFATLREEAGVDRVALDLSAGATAEGAWRALVAQHPALAARRPHLTAAVNRKYAPWDGTLADGDEIAFIPPVSGG
jgi:molybdopterin converting factor subunit 1